MRYQLIGQTSDDDTIEVELDAADAADAVLDLADLLARGETPTVHTWHERHATGRLTRVYARPVA